MLLNYFKIALIVLKRRKFFTFISLFGISLTLTILMLVTAFMDKMLSPSYPDLKRNRSLYVSNVLMVNSKDGWMNGSSLSYDLLKNHIFKLKTPEIIGMYSFSQPSNAYINNKKIVIDYKYTDANYWKIAEYEFIEGKAFDEQQLNEAQRVGVISESTKKAYFGADPTVIGKYIETDNVRYRVIGVVRDVPETMRNFYSDLYIPYTVSKSDYKQPGLMGSFGAVLLAPSVADIPRMKKEYYDMISKISTGDKDYDKLYAHPYTMLEAYSSKIFGSVEEPGLPKMFVIVTAFVLLFLLLPTINLVNINITRIIERSSEIGVRKAFGASSSTLVLQFIIENIIVTLFGGLIGVLLSALSIYLFNASDLIPNLNLTLNYRVLGLGLLFCLVFGVLSGVYPAWRMSRLNVVNALKAQ